MAHETITAVGLVRAAFRSRISGFWQAVRTYLEGRAAIGFEQERRATLLAVSPVLRPGAWIRDRRPDGSVLELHVPAVGFSPPPAGLGARQGYAFVEFSSHHLLAYGSDSPVMDPAPAGE